MQDSLLGRQLGQYAIESELGSGGMARVYRARQESLKRTVAIKVMSPALSGDRQFLERFRREATAIAALEHQNILPVYDFGYEKGVAYIAMMYVAGRTLRDYMLQTPTGPNRLPNMLKLASQVSRALDYAHQHGVVHRDIKPANVLLRETSEGAEPWALLSDFGIAKVMEDRDGLTKTGTGIGTPEYMSPEQAQGQAVDGRSDIYSLGIMLYEMVTGTVPFKADSAFATAYLHISAPLPRPRNLAPGLPPRVEAIILKATAKKPGDRYATAAELSEALMAAAGTGPETPRPLIDSTEVANAMSGVVNVASETAASARTAFAGATGAIGGTARDIGAVAGAAGQRVGAAGQRVGDVAGQVVHADWAGASVFVIRRLVMTGVAAAMLALFLSLLVLLSDARGQIAQNGNVWGVSLRSGASVDVVLTEAFPPTLELASIGIVLGALLAGSAAVFATTFGGGFSSTVGRTIGITWFGIPAVSLSSALLLPVIAVAGKPPEWEPLSAGLTPHLAVILLPAACAALLIGSALVQRGHEELAIWEASTWRHTWARRPALFLRLLSLPLRMFGPIIAVLAMVELIFNIPGVGRTLVMAAVYGDYSVFFDGMLRAGILVLLARLLADTLLILETAFTNSVDLEHIQRPSRSSGFAVTLLLIGVGAILVVLGIVMSFSGPLRAMNVVSQSVVDSALGGLLAIAMGAGIGVAAWVGSQAGRVAGPWLRDLILAPADALAAVPWLLLIMAQAAFAPNGRPGFVIIAAITALILAPRVGRSLAGHLTRGGWPHLIMALPMMIPAVLAVAFIAQLSTLRVLTEGREGLLALEGDAPAVLLGLVISTTIAACWYGASAGMRALLGLPLPTPLSETQD